MSELLHLLAYQYVEDMTERRAPYRHRRAVDLAGLEALQDRAIELLPDPGALPLLQTAVCCGQ